VVHGREEPPDVDPQDVAASAEEVRGAEQRPMRPLPGATGEGLGRERALDRGEGLGDEQVLGDPVAEGEREDAARLRVVDPEGAPGPRPVGAGGEVGAQLRDRSLEVEEEAGDVGGAPLAAGGDPGQAGERGWRPPA
jgi:hypothetical protein